MKVSQTLHVLGVFPSSWRYHYEAPYRIHECNLADLDGFETDYYHVKEITVDIEVDEQGEEMLQAVTRAIEKLEEEKREERAALHEKLARIDERIADFRKLTYQPEAQEYLSNEDKEDSGDNTDL